MGVKLESLRVYRNLLKAVKKHIGSKKQFTDYITQEFRSTSSLTTDPSLIKQKVNLASNHTYMLNSIHHHQVLTYMLQFNLYSFCSFILKKISRGFIIQLVVGLQLPEVYRA
ncbi:hypothetical protein MKX03_012323 [Papaver bracteatum]|nr:hypothetical protein MKX03_012323 [Papaver bracteatum]